MFPVKRLVGFPPEKVKIYRLPRSGFFTGTCQLHYNIKVVTKTWL